MPADYISDFEVFFEGIEDPDYRIAKIIQMQYWVDCPLEDFIRERRFYFIEEREE